MRKFITLLLILFFGYTSHAQFNSRINLKEFVGNIVNGSEKFKNAKIKVYLKDEEVKDLSKYEIDIDGLDLKVQMIESDKKEEIVEIKINSKSFKVS